MSIVVVHITTPKLTQSHFGVVGSIKNVFDKSERKKLEQLTKKYAEISQVHLELQKKQRSSGTTKNHCTPTRAKIEEVLGPKEGR